MREIISVESRIAMLLQRLGTGNTLYIVCEVYGVAESTISEIVRIFCKLCKSTFTRDFCTIFKSSSV